MIDINELKQGDHLIFTDGGQWKFVAIHNGYDGYGLLLFDVIGRNYKLFDTTVITDITSWKRDGVEQLKQEEENPLYVFCPIEKNDCNEFCIVDTKKIGDADNWPHTLPQIGRQSGKYIFIGYARSDIHKERIKAGKAYSSTSLLTKDGIVKICPFAVFMLTSELHVGGE